MRILFCNYEYPPLGGGGGVINRLLAEELAKKHEITVLTSHGPGLALESEADGVRVVRVPVYFRSQAAVANFPSMFAYMFAGARFGRKVFRESFFDVINTHFALPTGPVGDSLARSLKIPNVLTVHGGDLYDPSKFSSPHRHFFLRSWVRRLLRKADRIVGQSTNTLQNMRTLYTPDIVGERIPLGIRRPKNEAAERREYGFGKDEFLMVTVGRLVARKAVEQLISMVGRLRKEKVRLLIMGDGPLEKTLKEKASLEGVADRVTFLGHVEEYEKFKILHMCDVFVSTSQHEGFGLVFLEAMASGLPVVCYDHGGQTDFLKNAETGYLVSFNNFSEFLRRCKQLILNPGLRKEMRKENLKRVESYFIDDCARRYEDVFRKVIEEYRVPSRKDGRLSA